VFGAPLPAHAPTRQAANPAKTAPMAKRKAAAPKQKRRPRGEIDRNYFLGDVFIKTGVAMVVAIALVVVYAPLMLRDAITSHHYAYPALLAAFAMVGGICFMLGRHLRASATQWEAD